MTNPTDAEVIERARAMLATQSPLEVRVYEGHAWLADKDGEICIGAYPDGRPREDQARAIAMMINAGLALLDVLEELVAERLALAETMLDKKAATSIQVLTNSALAALRREVE